MLRRSWCGRASGWRSRSRTRAGRPDADGRTWVTVPGWTRLGGTTMGTFGRGFTQAARSAGCSARGGGRARLVVALRRCWLRVRVRATGGPGRVRSGAASATAPSPRPRRPAEAAGPRPRASSPRPSAPPRPSPTTPRWPPRARRSRWTSTPAAASTEIRLDVDGPPAEPGLRRARARQRLRPDRRRGRPALPEPGRPGRGAGQALHGPGLRQPAERDLARPAHRRRRRRRVAGGGAVRVHRPRARRRS